MTKEFDSGYVVMDGQQGRSPIEGYQHQDFSLHLSYTTVGCVVLVHIGMVFDVCM